MEVAFRLRRQTDRSGIPYWQTYLLDLEPDRGTVLDALQRIQGELDGTLGFRCNCRNVICGSCAIGIHQKPSLACQKSVGEVMRAGVVEIEPLGNFPVIKDLIVDMGSFWQDLQRVQPSVVATGMEQRQTPKERSVVAAAAGCILCGACYSACNVKEVNSQFVGPHALAKAQRILSDRRDSRTTDRLNTYHHNDFVWGCTRCWHCNEVCPVGVQPLDRISEVKQMLLQDRQTKVTTAIKHRRVLVSLVKRSGWLDEALFALQVVGILSVLPLGIKLIMRHKFPYPWQFSASAGKQQIQQLVDAIGANSHNRYLGLL